AGPRVGGRAGAPPPPPTPRAPPRPPARARAGRAAPPTVPPPWHPPQPPAPLVAPQPHSAQRYIGPVDDFPMPRTVTAGCDTPGERGGESAPLPGCLKKAGARRGIASPAAGRQRGEERFRNICGHLRFLSDGSERLNAASRIS